jgi:hypothetical protein
MQHFAHFLEGCGYVSVTKALDDMLMIYDTIQNKELDNMCGGTD